MKQEVIDKFMKDLQVFNDELNSIKSPTIQAITWLQNFPKLLEPVWKDGYDSGLKEGQKQKSLTIIKKLTEEN